MKTTRAFLLLSVVVAVLVLGVVYAAIDNITLTVNGTASASADQGNFDVKFTGTPVVKADEGSNGSGTLVIDNGSLTATMNVSGFKKVGDTVTATIDITNASTDLGATLAVSKSAIAEKLGAQTLESSEYFKVLSAELDAEGTELDAGETTKLTIKVQLVKVPVTADVTGTFSVTVVATPVN